MHAQGVGGVGLGGVGTGLIFFIGSSLEEGEYMADKDWFIKQSP